MPVRCAPEFGATENWKLPGPMVESEGPPEVIVSQELSLDAGREQPAGDTEFMVTTILAVVPGLATVVDVDERDTDVQGVCPKPTAHTASKLKRRRRII